MPSLVVSSSLKTLAVTTVTSIVVPISQWHRSLTEIIRVNMRMQPAQVDTSASLASGCSLCSSCYFVFLACTRSSPTQPLRPSSAGPGTSLTCIGFGTRILARFASVTICKRRRVAKMTLVAHSWSKQELSLIICCSLSGWSSLWSPSVWSASSSL